MRSPLTTLRHNAPQLSPNVFLAYHPGSWIQYYDDTPAKDPTKAFSTRFFSPAFAAKKQQERCAVCFSLQAFKGARTKEHLTQFRTLGVDVDLVPQAERQSLTAEEIDTRKDEYLRKVLLPFPLKPHWLVETLHGFHVLFRNQPVTDTEGIRTAETINRQLVSVLKGDASASLLTQVLRVPGFQQFKDPSKPFLCRLLLHNPDLIQPYDLSNVRSVLDAWEVFDEWKQPGQKPPVAGEQSKKKWEEGLQGVAEGSRNDTAASLCGKILRDLPENLWETAGLGGLREWNQRNSSPLPEPELRTVLASVARRERIRRQREGQEKESPSQQESAVPVQEPVVAAQAAGPSRKSGSKAQGQADKLAALVTDENAVLFTDQFGEPHAHILLGQHWKTCKLRGQEFREWLAQRLWEAEGKACGTEAMNSVLNTLAGKARYEGKRIVLENRLARHEGAIWFDLCDSEGRAVRVTAEGWEIVAQPPILFRHFPHQLPQVLPVKGKPLAALTPLLNLANPKRIPLLLTYLVTCLVPDIPHPIALFYGPQGAAKSTLCKLLRRLLDPSSLEGLALPEAGQMPQLLFHHWFPVFDNVSGLSSELSDIFCRAVTGDSFSRRKLYTDDEDVIYQFRRCLCLNGINLAAEKPDLLDRCLLFSLEQISEDSRQEERAVLQAFEELRPELLGALFDALSGAMRNLDAVQLSPLPRMADFARWGAAAAEALSIGAGAFLTLYHDNIRQQHEEAIEVNPVALAVADFMAVREEWSGTPTQLLRILEGRSRRGEGMDGVSGLPRQPNQLTKQLNITKMNLAQMGIQIDTGRRTGSRRLISIHRVAPPPATEDRPSPQKRLADATSSRSDGRDGAPETPLASSTVS